MKRSKSIVIALNLWAHLSFSIFCMNTNTDVKSISSSCYYTLFINDVNKLVVIDHLNGSIVPLLTLSDENFIQVALSDHHALALTENGILYEWHEENPHLMSSYSPPFFKKYDFNKRIIELSSSNFYSFILTENNTIFYRAYDEDKQVSSPWKELNTLKEKIIHISAGTRCAFFINDKGQLFGFGKNNAGQFGVESEEVFSKPLHLPLIKNPIKSITSNCCFLSITEEQGNAFILDNSIFIDLLESKHQRHMTTYFSSKENVSHIATAKSHAFLVLTKDGQVSLLVPDQRDEILGPTSHCPTIAISLAKENFVLLDNFGTISLYQYKDATYKKNKAVQDQKALTHLGWSPKNHWLHSTKIHRIIKAVLLSNRTIPKLKRIPKPVLYIIFRMMMDR